MGRPAQMSAFGRMTATATGKNRNMKWKLLLAAALIGLFIANRRLGWIGVKTAAKLA